MPHGEFVVFVDSEADTERLAQALAHSLPPQITLGLVGTLGAGKTRLVQGLAAAVGVPRELVTSPTFVLCQHYQGTTRINHLDAYRLRDEDEWFELGVEELMSQPGWTVIEWADRFAEFWVEPWLEVTLEILDRPEQRRVTLRAQGLAAGRALAQLRARLAGS